MENEKVTSRNIVGDDFASYLSYLHKSERQKDEMISRWRTLGMASIIVNLAFAVRVIAGWIF